MCLTLLASLAICGHQPGPLCPQNPGSSSLTTSLVFAGGSLTLGVYCSGERKGQRAWVGLGGDAAPFRVHSTPKALGSMSNILCTRCGGSTLQSLHWGDKANRIEIK